MADHPELRGYITIEDQGSDALRKIAQEIHHISAAAVHAGHSIKHIEHEGALVVLREHTKEVNEGFARMRESVAKVHEGVLDLLPAFGALTAGATVAGAFELLNSQGEKLEALGHAAKTIGITIHDLQKLHFAADLTGTSTEILDKTMERLNKTISEAAHGQNRAAAATFSQARIQLYANGHLRDAADILPELADGFMHTASAADRAKIAQLLGGKSAQEALPFLLKGGAIIREMGEEFDRLHPTSPEGQKAIAEWTDGLKKMKAASDGFQESIGGLLSPIFAPLQNEATEFLATQSRLALQHEGIGGFIEQQGKKVRDFLEKVDWKNMAEDLRLVGDGADFVAQKLGGWSVAAEILAGAWAAKTALFFVSPIIQAGRLALALGAEATALGSVAAGWARVGAAAAVAADAERGAVAAEGVAGGGAVAGAVAGAAGKIGRVGRLGLWGAGLYALFDETKWLAESPADYSAPLPTAGAENALKHAGFSWPDVERMPRQDSLYKIAARLVGEDYTGIKPFFSSPLQTHDGDRDPFAWYHDYLSSPFANPIFDANRQAGDNRGGVALPPLKGKLDISINIPGLPAGSGVIVTGHHGLDDLLGEVDAGDYGRRH